MNPNPVFPNVELPQVNEDEPLQQPVLQLPANINRGIDNISAASSRFARRASAGASSLASGASSLASSATSGIRRRRQRKSSLKGITQALDVNNTTEAMRLFNANRHTFSPDDENLIHREINWLINYNNVNKIREKLEESVGLDVPQMIRIVDTQREYFQRNIDAFTDEGRQVIDTVLTQYEARVESGRAMLLRGQHGAGDVFFRNID
jgi:hypothetical protein